MRLPRAICLVSLSLILESTSHAQFGLSGILNPEGSRLFPQTLTIPRHPGKPDPRWKTFNWEFLDRDVNGAKYRLYFYQGEEWIVRYALPQIEEQIRSLIKIFHYVPSKQFTYLLLGSRTEFQQINIFNITEGVQGITSTTERTMAIPYWGEAETFRHISTHELVHQIQIQKVMDLNESQSARVLEIIPLWFIEGMAEYYSLGGMDAESRQYVRDLLLYPKPELDFRIPKLFDSGPLNFIQIYKMGQARIDFFENQFGEGTVQRILVATTDKSDSEKRTFEAIVKSELKQTAEELENKWQDYIYKIYKTEADQLSQSMNQFEELTEVGDTLDLFAISPNGQFLATREIEPSTGVSLINLRSLSDLNQKIQVAQDRKPNLLSLFFMQIPTLTLSDQSLVYIVATTLGPEVEIRTFSKDNEGAIQLGHPRRISLHELGIIEAHSPALSPDQTKLALVGLKAKGWENIYEINLANLKDNSSPVNHSRQLTNEYYAWKNLTWETDGIYASSNRTHNKKFNLFRIKPNQESTTLEEITASPFNQLDPEIGEGTLFFQSWAIGSSQIHTFKNNRENQLTEAKVGLSSPIFRKDHLYSLGLKNGRNHLYRIQKSRWLQKKVPPLLSPKQNGKDPWDAKLANIPELSVEKYRPFLTSGGYRIEDLGAFFSSGLVGGINIAASDLMRDYTFSGQISYLGRYGLSNTYLLFGDRKGKSKWNVGVYHSLQPRLDNIFSAENDIKTYINRETGGVASFEYPLGAYSYFDMGLRAGRVKRTSYSDASLSAAWELQNPGNELILAPILRIGHDEVLYETFTGPLRGYGILLESETTFFPEQSSSNERLRLDAAYYFQPFDRTVIAIQGLAGTSWGGNFRNPFLVSSDDIFRAYPVFDSRLYGNYLVGAKVEFRIPIGAFFNFPILRGMVAYDFGSVFVRKENFIENITSSYTGGLNLNIPPLGISFLLTIPGRVAPGPPIDSPVIHFLLRYLYL